MKKTRKFLLTMLSVLTVAAVSFGAASCELLEILSQSIPPINIPTWDKSSLDNSTGDSSSGSSSMENSSSEDSSSAHTEHTWAESYSYDDSYHWIECNVCHEVKDKAEHTLNESGECSVCKALLKATEGVQYRISSDNMYAEVIGYEGTATRVRIADTYNDLPVKTIFDKAFYENRTITSVMIPDSVTSIGEAAFCYCRGLTSVKISDSVTSIGLSVFSSCDNLTSVEIPDSVTLIDDGAFYHCINLVRVKIPDSVTSIGYRAFSACNSLTSVVIPDSVTSIGLYAFDGCDNLMSVYITDIVDWCNISFGNDYANPLYYGANLYLNNELLTELVIPDTITEIKPYAFYNCSSLASVEISDSVTSIGFSAFYNCDGLTSVVIGNSVTSIDDGAFESCRSLTSVEIGDNVTSIGEDAFEYCYKLVEVVNKSTHISVTKGSSSNGYVGYYALAVYNSGDTFESKLSIDNGYSIYTDGEEKILVGYTGTETDLVLPSYATKIYQYAFYDCDNLTSVTIGDSVTSIGNRAFYNCDGLTSVTIGDSVTSIDNRAFFYCRSLTSVKIPDSVTLISEMAFSGCSNMTSVEISNSVTSIGEHAFDSCYKLVEVVNKSTHITVEKGSFSNGCVGYYALAVYNSGDTFESKLSNDNGYSIYTDGEEKILVGYTGTETDLVLPSYITKIYQYAFYWCKSLTSVVIPDSVTSIGMWAFYNCDGLTSVTIGDGVTSIGYGAFYGCSSLTNVYYNGTESEWAAISINSSFTNTYATRYYYSETEPTEEGNYWHYVDGVPTKW